MDKHFMGGIDVDYLINFTALYNTGMDTPKPNLTSLFFLCLLLISANAFCQDRILIDSLQNRLQKMNHLNGGIHVKNSIPDTAKADLLYELVVAYFGTVPDTAIWYANQLKNIAEKIAYMRGTGNYYNGLGLINMVKGRDYKLALESFMKALKIRQDIGDKVGMAWTFNNLGNMYGGEGNYNESVKNHINAFNVRSEIGDNGGMTESLIKMGRCYIELGNYPEALKDYLTSLKVAEDAGYMQGVEAAYKMIGELYEKEGNYTEAMKNYIASSKVVENRGDQVGVANSYELMANIFVHQGDTLNALNKYQAALKVLEDVKSSYGVSKMHSQIGNIKFNQGKYEEALAHFKVSLAISEELKDQNLISNSLLNMAMVYEKMGRQNDALNYARKALTIALEINNKYDAKEAYRILSIIYAMMKDYQAAYQNNILYQRLRDTLYNAENAGKMKQLEMQYSFDKDAAILKAEQEKKDSILAKEAETQRYRRNIIFLVMALIVFFLIVVIFLRSRIAIERRQKALEMERSRISRDLHDDLGSGLTKISMMSQVAQKNTGIEHLGTLQRITSESSEMVDMMNGIIWAMNTKNDTLHNLFSFLKINAFDLFEDSSIKLIWEEHETNPEIAVYGEARRNIYLVVKEALHNVLKYSNANQVKINLNANNERLHITIEDDGEGFDTESLGIKNSGGGNGLLNMKKRIEEINGTFSISSKINAGTKVAIECNLQTPTKV